MSWFARAPGEFCVQITKVEHKEEMRLCITHEVIGMQTLAPKGGLVHENRPTTERRGEECSLFCADFTPARAWKVKERQKLRRFTKDRDPMEH